MSTKPSSHTASSRQRKKSQFSKPATKKAYKKNAIILGALGMIGLLSYFFGRGLADQPRRPRPPSQRPVPAEAPQMATQLDPVTS